MPLSEKAQDQIMPLGNFAENFRHAMAHSGLTQIQLAQQTKICTQSDISRYLTTSRIPSGDKLVDLALALGTTAEYLITGKALALNAAPSMAPRPARVSDKTLRLAAQAAEAIIALQDELKKMP